MNTWALLLGILPLLLFVIVDSFAGLKAGLIAAFAVAILEAIFSFALLGNIDMVTLGSLLLVFILGLASWKMKSPLLFKMQPVVLGAALSLILVISYYIGKPFLYIMMTKYQEHFPPQVKAYMGNPLYLELLKLSTLYCGFTILAQTSLVAYAALKMNNWWWIAFRGIGFYVFLFIGFLAAQYQIIKNYS